jgi:hypothetical protein
MHLFLLQQQQQQQICDIYSWYPQMQHCIDSSNATECDGNGQRPLILTSANFCNSLLKVDAIVCVVKSPSEAGR